MIAQRLVNSNFVKALPSSDFVCFRDPQETCRSFREAAFVFSFVEHSVACRRPILVLAHVEHAFFHPKRPNGP